MASPSTLSDAARSFRSMIITRLAARNVTLEDLEMRSIHLWDPHVTEPEITLKWVANDELSDAAIIGTQAYLQNVGGKVSLPIFEQERKVGASMTLQLLDRAGDETRRVGIWALAALASLADVATRLKNTAHSEQGNRAADVLETIRFAEECAGHDAGSLRKHWPHMTRSGLPLVTGKIQTLPEAAVHIIAGIARVTETHRPVRVIRSPHPEAEQMRCRILARAQELKENPDETPGLRKRASLLKRYNALPEKWRACIMPGARCLNESTDDEIIAERRTMTLEAMSVFYGVTVPTMAKHVRLARGRIGTRYERVRASEGITIRGQETSTNILTATDLKAMDDKSILSLSASMPRHELIKRTTVSRRALNALIDDAASRLRSGNQGHRAAG